jgi:molybdopterin/thiamine biosynthesis adenylyltransferase
MTPADRERYSRQILFSGIGEEGQERLLACHVAIVGCGALGSFQAAALARAGVGRLTLLDRDYVEPSNLQRQWLFEEADAEAALPKAVAAERALARVNSSVMVTGVVADLTPSNVEELLGEADLILDGTDNFETRYLINDYCVSRRSPWIYGAAVGSYGVTMPIIPERSACFRCVYPEPPEGPQPTCETAGVLNSVTAMIAALQVADALKLLCTGSLDPRLTTLDVWTGAMRRIELPARDPDCPACGYRQFPYLDGDRLSPVSLCGRNAVQIHEQRSSVDLQDLKNRLSPLGEVRANEFGLRFFCPPYEMTIFRDGRAIVKGTTDTGLARSLYARFIGL